MKIKKNNRLVDEFKGVGHHREARALWLLYSAISPDVNFLRKLLVPVVSQVVWCPENGKWRCAATVLLDEGQLAIFFPWILPSGQEHRPVSIGVQGNVELKDIKELCQKILTIFEQNIPPGAVMV